MRTPFLTLLLCFASAAAATAQETPLTAVPYTPSLDPSFIDKTVDPCVDFYQFTCGNWNKLNPIPADEDRWNVYSKLAEQNQRLLWGLLVQAQSPARNRTPNEQKIGDYFGSCMNTDAVEKAGAEPLSEALGRIAKLDRKIDLASYIAWQHTQGVDQELLFNFASGQNFKDASQVIAFFNAAGLGLPDRDYYVGTEPRFVENRKRYLEHVEKMFQLLGESAPDAAADAKTVMEIETELAKASLTLVQERDPHNLDHPVDAAQLRASAPHFDWDSYLKTVNLGNSQRFNLSEPKFFSRVDELVKERSLAQWKTYLRWHLIHSYAPYLSSQFADENFDFYGRYLRGVTAQPPRWKKCTRLVDHDLGEALGEVYVAKTFSGNTKSDVLKMTRQIENEMDLDIHQLTWMGPATKAQALEKLHAIVNKIGYPDKWRDYSSLAITPTDFARNAQRATAFEFRRDLNKIGKPLNRGEWLMTPPTVNAYYDPQMNDINFPAGVLQPPLYDPKLDTAPNYGDTGATIGHELTHGFDDQGRLFDAKGNLRDWWTEADSKQFTARVSCVQNQYAQYTVIDDIKINSQLTSGEDVADIGGTLLAYLAWKKDTAGKQLPSDGGFTPDQRFFIGMAQWACGDQRPESKRMHAVTDPHSPDKFRINGVVSDLPEFARAFGCKAGQPMVAAHACRVW